MKTAKAEQIRLQYRYRNLILKGKLKVPLSTAKKLIGPDTAYHLYKDQKTEVRSQGKYPRAKAAKSAKKTDRI